MKLLKISSVILLIVLIIASMLITIIITQNYSSNKGSIEGTGFVKQELNGAGGVSFDVDDNGNIYFAIDISKGRGIDVYNSIGNFIYSLPIHSGGGIRVRIDENNNILVYDIREKAVIQYNNLGIEKNLINDDDYSLRDDFPDTINENERVRNGIRYVNINGTITKYENGVETIVFTVPTWQRWEQAFSLIMILSIVALFLRLAIPQWVKAFKNRYGNGA